MDNSSNTVISIKTAPSNCGAGAGKKNLYTISGILNFEKPLTERVLEKKIVIENDDTSDEEEELKTPINPYYILSEETVSAEIKSSFLLLNIGIRIIRSPEVAKHYFNWKRKNDLEKIVRFPTDDEFTKIIYESFKKLSLSISLTAEKFEEILATKNYENLENLLIACKRKIIARKDFFLKGPIKVQIKNL